MKKEFIKFLQELINANPDLAESLMTPEVKAYIEILTAEQVAKPDLTENGKKILEFLKEHSDQKLWKARDIGEELFIHSRSVSGTLRKLVSDGFCEKIDGEPLLYAITEKGKEYNIE